MTHSARRLSLLAALLAFALARPALASDEAARARFSAGVKQYDAKDYAGALESFRAADLEKPSAATKRNVGLCLRALGRYAEATMALEAMLAGEGSALPPEVRAKTQRALDEMRPRVAIVRVRVDAPSAEVRVDDALVAPSRVVLAPGTHVIRAVAPGYEEATRDVTLAKGDDAVVALTLVAAAPLPPPPPAVEAPPDASGPLPPAPPPFEPELAPAAKRFDPRGYLRGGVGFSNETRRMASALDEPSSGTSRGFGEVSLVARGGFPVSRWVDLELLAELGAMAPSSYASPRDPRVPADVHVTHEALVPMVRLHTQGALRLVLATGIGLELEQLHAALSEGTAGVATKSGAGVGPAWIAEVGTELQLGRALLEADFFVDMHDIGGLKDASGGRFFLDETLARAGARLTVGWQL